MSNNQSSIETVEFTIENLLSKDGDFFKIPDYQRRYSWEEQHINDFWYDLNNIEDEDDEEHFLGSIVLIPKRTEIDGFRKSEVVDGQQRLTTLLILLKVIQIKLAEDKENIASKINDSYIYTSNNLNVKKLRLILGKLDNNDFKMIMNNDFNNKDDFENENIFEAYEFFRSKLSVEEIDDIIKIYNKLLKKIIIVKIEAKNEKSAFRLFETLNDRGLVLSIKLIH